jgi:hypothetical protein
MYFSINVSFSCSSIIFSFSNVCFLVWYRMSGLKSSDYVVTKCCYCECLCVSFWMCEVFYCVCVCVSFWMCEVFFYMCLCIFLNVWGFYCMCLCVSFWMCEVFLYVCLCIFLNVWVCVCASFWMCECVCMTMIVALGIYLFVSGWMFACNWLQQFFMPLIPWKEHWSTIKPIFSITEGFVDLTFFCAVKCAKTKCLIESRLTLC